MTINVNKEIKVRYYSLLKEKRGVPEEDVFTAGQTALDLFMELDGRYHFGLAPDQLRVAVNDEFCPWQTKIKSGDQIIFLPPVSGG